MDKTKKKSNKRAYLDDFILNDHGEYDYKGVVYKPTGQIDKKMMTMLIVCGFACIILAGFIPFSGSMHAFYIIMPYMVEIVLFGLLSYSFIQFVYHLNELREYIFNKSYLRFRPYSVLLFGNYGLSIICTLVYSLINGFEIWAIIYTLFQIMSFIFIRKFYLYTNSMNFN